MAFDLARDWLGWAKGRFVTNLARTVPDTQSAPMYFHHRKTAAGVYVTPDNAMTQAAVWACITYLSRMIAQLPWPVLLPNKDGGADQQPTHPVTWLLNTRPCPDYGSFNWRQLMLGHALLYGNAYAEIERDIRGVASALWPIHPSRVFVKRGSDGTLVYQVTNRGSQTVDMFNNEIFHVRGFGDGPVGFSVIEFAAQTIGWAQATELFGSSYFGEGMNPSGVITVQKGLSPAAMSHLRKELQSLYYGPKGEKTAILDAGMEWKSISSDPEKGQFVSTMQHQVEQICRFFGVPPHKIQHMLRSTFSNVEAQNTEVVIDSLVPWARVFEDEANYKIFGQNRLGYYTKLQINGLLRGDSASRAQLYKALFEMGALTSNDILRLEDRNPIGKDGDVRFVSNNVQTMENAKKEKVEPTSGPVSIEKDPEGEADESMRNRLDVLYSRADSIGSETVIPNGHSLNGHSESGYDA